MAKLRVLFSLINDEHAVTQYEKTFVVDFAPQVGVGDFIVVFGDRSLEVVKRFWAEDGVLTVRLRRAAESADINDRLPAGAMRWSYISDLETKLADAGWKPLEK